MNQPLQATLLVVAAIFFILVTSSVLAGFGFDLDQGRIDMIISLLIGAGAAGPAGYIYGSLRSGPGSDGESPAE